MKKIMILIISMMMLMTLSTFGSAVDLDVRPSDGNNINGVSLDYAPGFQTGSIASNGSGKTEFYFTPDILFEKNITLGEISEMSYWTKKNTTHVVNAADWYLAIYTKPYEGDLGSWYGDRIGAEPYFSINLSDPVDTWNIWSTNSTENRLRFFESTLGYFGSYTDPDWETFVSGTALSGDSYAGHEVKFFSVQTGSGWADGFTGQVDGLTIKLTDGSVAKVNFEDVFIRSAEITSPSEGSTVSGMVDFTAYLTDDDVDAIQWAVREGTCAAGTNTVFGNVDSHSDMADIDTSDLAMQTFSFTGDMSTMDSGMYCFIYNPKEDGGESEIRETVEFNLEKATPTDKDECKKGGWMTFTNPTFKNQGDCVSWLQSSPNAEGNRKDN